MLAYTFYESDNRVMRYAETLAARGDHVDVLSLRQNDDAPIDVIKGVGSITSRREHNERGKLSYLAECSNFSPAHRGC